MRILIIEDDNGIGLEVKKLLQKHNYIVDLVRDCDNFRHKVDYQDYDLIILDWLLPDCSGAELCRELRESDNQNPILMLTSKTDLKDKIAIFEIGADDYLSKPFAIEEFLVRVKALIRRKSGLTISPIIVLNGLEINTNTNQVKKDGQIINLSPKEYGLLEYLAFNEGKVINRLELLSHVWGDDSNYFSNTVDVHIRYLRKKIENREFRLIKTVKNKGYLISLN